MHYGKYIIRCARSKEDVKDLKQLFNTVFYPEQVGVFAEAMFNHLPGQKNNYWFIAEEEGSAAIVSAFALLPWSWKMDNIDLKVAELGIVGTHKEYRNQGLIKALYKEFKRTIHNEQYDLAVIQGIPGFYNRFGFYYTLPMDNDFVVPFHGITTDYRKSGYTFRIAGTEDLDFFMEEDNAYRKKFFISTFRSKENWKYLFTESLKTEYGSQFWIMEGDGAGEKYYFRIPCHGFGQGLIISEVSEGISVSGVQALFSFCKEKAVALKKPFIRLNMSQHSTAVRLAMGLGAVEKPGYAWQVQVPDTVSLLTKMVPVFEGRMAAGPFRGLSETVTIDQYRFKVNIRFEKGKVRSVEQGEGDHRYTLSVSSDLFPALCLGYRSRQELNFSRPDLLMFMEDVESGMFFDMLFPKKESWMYIQY